MEASLTSSLPLRPTQTPNTAADPAAAAAPRACSVPLQPNGCLNVISTCMVHPSRKSDMGELKLSVSDLPMLASNYIQNGLIFPRPPVPIHHLLSLLRLSLSWTLSYFPALAGRLVTHPDGRICISCNDAGVPYSHHALPTCAGGGPVLTLPQITRSVSWEDVPEAIKDLLFDLDGAVGYDGHTHPLAAVRVTELSDGSLFIGCTINHAVVDGTSFWNFFNSWAELCHRRGATLDAANGISPLTPDFTRNFFGESKAVLMFADDRAPAVTSDTNDPFRERIFHFSREAIRELKAVVNRHSDRTAEICGKTVNDTVDTDKSTNRTAEISSFQSLCALLWRSVTRARRDKLGPESSTTISLAVNCRHRVDPPVDPLYFGNAIQSITATAAVGEVVTRELRWGAALLHRSVAAHGRERVREVVAEWERTPRCLRLGNPDGSVVMVGGSPRFPVYVNDFGWGRPVAVRSGRANKFDGMVSAFPAAAGDGGVDLEVCLAPDTMDALVFDRDFMGYVSQPSGCLAVR